MHIAVCDDNIADRKQLERLLKRESDRRKDGTGLLYVSSFGDSEVLSRNPMPYDLFFIDMTQEVTDGFDFALSLISAGVTAPIVLCSSKIDYLKKIDALTKQPSNLMHLQKAIKTAELSEIIDRALELQSKRVPTIELRSEKDTYYVLEDDIVYATPSGRYVHVFLADGREIPILTTMSNFYDQIAMYTHIVLIGEHALFNIVYLDSFTLFSVTLKNGIRLKSTPFASKYIKEALQKYEAEQLS